MKYILTISFLFSFNGFNQSIKTDSKASTDTIINNYVSIKKELEMENFENRILEKILNQASDTIANQSALIDSFSTIFTIMGLVLAVFALALPGFTYLLGIRPSQDAVKELHNNIDAKINSYLLSNREKANCLAIEQLLSSTEINNTKIKAAQYIANTSHEALSELHIFKLTKVLQTNIGLDSIAYNQVANVVASTETEYATSLFSSVILHNIIPPLHSLAFKYFSIHNINTLISLLKIYFENNIDRVATFLSVSDSIGFANKNALLAVYNSETVINVIKYRADEIGFIMSPYHRAMGISQTEFSATLLGQEHIKSQAEAQSQVQPGAQE